MTVELTSDDNGQFALAGELTFQTVPQVAQKIASMLDDHGDIMVDLHGVSHSDSAGVAMLVDWVRSAREAGCEIAYLNIPPQMLSIARVSGLDTILPLSRR